MFQEDVVNGSRYPATINYVVAETDETTSLVIDVGHIYQVPCNATKLTINLRDAEHTEILKNLAINEGVRSGRSTIITEEGTIAHGEMQYGVDDWMWKSSADRTHHKPRSFFVANASGEEITVQQLDRDGKPSTHSFVRIQHGDVSTLVFDRIIIRPTFKSSEYKIIQDTIKPLTSIIVLPENRVKTTRKLYGEDIEDKKWIVDGRNYKPPSVNENLQNASS